jgi:microcompartment protein CcmL/EutN
MTTEKGEMMNQTFGLLEVNGWVAGIESLDAMLKSADVELYGTKEDNGRLLVVITGSPSVVSATLEVGGRCAEQFGTVIAKRVIAHPREETISMLNRLLCEMYPQERPHKPV